MLHALSDETIVELPQLAVELEAEYQWRQLENRLEKSGISLESHLCRLHKTREKLDASIRVHAAEDMKLRAVFLAVARQEGLTVSDAETEAAQPGDLPEHRSIGCSCANVCAWRKECDTSQNAWP